MKEKEKREERRGGSLYCSKKFTIWRKLLHNGINLSQSTISVSDILYVSNLLTMKKKSSHFFSSIFGVEMKEVYLTICFSSNMYIKRENIDLCKNGFKVI
jgi:hypothetical protein